MFDGGVEAASRDAGLHRLPGCRRLGEVCHVPDPDGAGPALRRTVEDDDLRRPRRRSAPTRRSPELAGRFFRGHGRRRSDGPRGGRDRSPRRAPGSPPCGTGWPAWRWTASSTPRPGDARPAGRRREAARDLPAARLRQFVLGYGDRSAVLDPAFADRIVPGGNGMFKPTVVTTAGSSAPGSGPGGAKRYRHRDAEVTDSFRPGPRRGLASSRDGLLPDPPRVAGRRARPPAAIRDLVAEVVGEDGGLRRLQRHRLRGSGPPPSGWRRPGPGAALDLRRGGGEPHAVEVGAEDPAVRTARTGRSRRPRPGSPQASAHSTESVTGLGAGLELRRPAEGLLAVPSTRRRRGAVGPATALDEPGSTTAAGPHPPATATTAGHQQRRPPTARRTRRWAAPGRATSGHRDVHQVGVRRSESPAGAFQMSCS